MTTLAAGTAKAISVLASLISVPITFRYLGPERYGIWMVLISITAAMGFADLGIGNGLMNAVSEAYGKNQRTLAKEHVTSALVLMLSIAICLSIACALVFPFLPWQRLFNVKSEAVAAEGAKAFLVLYASFVVNIPLGVIARAQAGLQKAYSAQMINALGSIVSLGAILLVAFLRSSLMWLVFASIFGNIIATLFNGWTLFHEHPWLIPSRSAYSTRSAGKILKLGIMFFALQCAFTLGFTSDNIVIAQILGASAVAVYAVPQKLFSSVSLLVSIGITPLWPAYSEAIARGDVVWVRRVFLGSLWLVASATIPLCALLVVGGPWILKTVVGKSLQAPMSLLIVLAMWGVVNAISAAISILLNGAGVLKEQAVLALIAGFANLALSIYLTRRVGVIGVCLGSIISQMVIAFPAYSILLPRLFVRLMRAEGENVA